MTNPFEVNSALLTLIAGEDHDGTAARIVIEFASTVPLTSKKSFRWVFPKFWPGKSITGYIPGFGNTRINDEDKEKTATIKLGRKAERIGEYRLWHSELGRINFRHYWDFDRTNFDQKPEDEKPLYHLVYNPDSGNLIYFAKEVNRTTKIWTWPINALFYETYLVAIHGTVPKKRYFSWQRNDTRLIDRILALQAGVFYTPACIFTSANGACALLL